LINNQTVLLGLFRFDTNKLWTNYLYITFLEGS